MLAPVVSVINGPWLAIEPRESFRLVLEKHVLSKLDMFITTNKILFMIETY
jgi:hypothetical protein